MGDGGSGNGLFGLGGCEGYGEHGGRNGELGGLFGGGGANGGKSRRSGRVQGRTWEPPMPRELLGQNSHTASGEPLCFDFNLGGCDRARPGQKRERGWHLRAKNGCNRAHGFRANH